jgi:hypothetical protein
MPDPNLPLLEDAVQKLAPFLEEVVFVGGITLGLLITDAAAAPIRGTTDVDVVAEIITYADYMEFSERLRKAQFTEDAGEKPLTCRWHFGALTLDVLPLNKEVLGFTNRWYAPALAHASTFTLPSGQSIRVITAPFFLICCRWILAAASRCLPQEVDVAGHVLHVAKRNRSHCSGA